MPAARKLVRLWTLTAEGYHPLVSAIRRWFQWVRPGFRYPVVLRGFHTLRQVQPRFWLVLYGWLSRTHFFPLAGSSPADFKLLSVGSIRAYRSICTVNQQQTIGRLCHLCEIRKPPSLKQSTGDICCFWTSVECKLFAEPLFVRTFHLENVDKIIMRIGDVKQDSNCNRENDLFPFLLQQSFIEFELEVSVKLPRYAQTSFRVFLDLCCFYWYVICIIIYIISVNIEYINILSFFLFS